MRHVLTLVGSVPVIGLGKDVVGACLLMLGVARSPADPLITFGGILRNSGPIMLGWFAAALVLKTYTHPGLVRFLATWALGISLGVALRSLFLGRAWNADEFAFYGVTLAVTLVLLSIWRGLVLAWTRLPARATGSA